MHQHGYRDESQRHRVEEMLKRWGRLRERRGGLNLPVSDDQIGMSAFLMWLAMPTTYTRAQPFGFRELRAHLDEPTIGMLFDLLMAFHTGVDAIDGWIGKYGPEIFG